MVQEIHQVLMDREDTCHRTCFSLQLDGNVLDNFAELKSIEGLQEGSVLKVVEGEMSEHVGLSSWSFGRLAGMVELLSRYLAVHVEPFYLLS